MINKYWDLTMYNFGDETDPPQTPYGAGTAVER